MDDNRFNRLVMLHSLITKREGMIADNLQRQHTGESMAWSGEEFRYLADEIWKLHYETILERIERLKEIDDGSK